MAAAISILTLSALAAPIAPPTTPPASPGYWLLDLAWNQAASLATAPSKVDATELLCLLQAATRLDPNLAEAWHQQYDLLRGLGRAGEAVDALRKYAQLVPDDEAAQMALAAEDIAAGETAEKRLAICREWLSRKDLPDAAAGFVLRTAAEIQHNRLQDDQALKDAQRCVEVFPYDLAAQRLLLELQGSSTLADDLNLDLWILRANPADAGTIIDAARIADSLGLYPDASQWYAQAQTLLTHFRQDTTGLTLQMADHWLTAGQPERAARMLEPLRSKPNTPAEAHLLLSEAYSLLGQTQQAREVAVMALRQPTTQPATASAPASAPAEVHAAASATAQTVCQNTWVRMMYLGAAGEPQAVETVFQAAPDQPWARRCYGWALLKADQPDKAIEVLKPIAQTDAWAALGLAQAYKAGNNTQAAAASLQQVQQLSPTGPAHRAAARWAATVNMALPTPDQAVVRRAQDLLAGFEKSLLDLPIEPGKFLKLKFLMDAPPLPGKPWFGRIELSNTSTVPIYCGPYGSLAPNVLLSAMVYEPATRDIGHRLLVSLQKQSVIKPGQTLSLYRPLDSGPLYNLLLNPYKTVQVLFTAMLDPVRMGNNQWMPGPIGLLTDPLTANRIASQPPRADDLLRQARSGSQDQKIDAARWIICILAGRQSKDAPQSQPALGPQSPLVQALVALLSDGDPLVVAHALAQPDQIPLIEPIFQAAMPHVNDANWLTRLLAVRFFARQQGDKFTHALKNLSQTDPDPLVRSLMAAYYAGYVAAGRK